MPIHEYECTSCDFKKDVLFTSVSEAERALNIPCGRCGAFTKRNMSAPNFKVVGFNAKNGYNLPNYDDVVNADGYAKERWGKKY